MGVFENEFSLNALIMEKMATDLSMQKPKMIEDNGKDSLESRLTPKPIENRTVDEVSTDSCCETKIKLSFSVDRLLNSAENEKDQNYVKEKPMKCDNDNIYACCIFPNCIIGSNHSRAHLMDSKSSYHGHMEKMPYPIMKNIVRPMPIRAMGSTCETDPMNMSLQRMSSSSYIRFHQQYKPSLHSTHNPLSTNLMYSSLLQPLGSLKPQHINSPPTQLGSFPSIAQSPGLGNTSSNSTITGSANKISNSASTNATNNSNGNNGKRKRSWSRAVFSNLQRKGLEIQFQQQKYITKPDRRKLAARLNLTDAQVKVWFQNRRMKWRHTRENLKSGQEKQISPTTDQSNTVLDKRQEVEHNRSEMMGLSTDSSSSDDEDDDDDNEIDVVQ